MAITVVEKPESRDWTKGKKGKLVYIVRGTSDDLAAVDALYAAAAATRGGLVRTDVDVEPLEAEVSSAWLGTVTYVEQPTEREPLAEGESSGYEFEIGGDTWHETQSLGTVIYGDNALDFKGAMVVHRDDDGNWSVDGTDLGNTSGAFHWSETKCFATSAVDDDYAELLSELVWTTNDDTFRGWSAGEVLFTGARGSKRGDDLWEITFSYAVMQNKGAFTVPEAGGAGSISVTAGKLGWEFLWVRYASVEDGTGLLQKVPVAVYVETVYEDSDFDTIEPT